MKQSLKRQNVPFTQISNIPIDDPDLSLKSLGLYVWMFSKPQGWKFSIRRICNQRPEGYDQIRSLVNELQERGYLTREKQSDGTVEYLLRIKPSKSSEKTPEIEKTPSADPVDSPVTGFPFKGKSLAGETPLRENPTQGKPVRISNSINTSNTQKNRNIGVGITREAQKKEDLFSAAETRAQIVEFNEAHQDFVQKLVAAFSMQGEHLERDLWSDCFRLFKKGYIFDFKRQTQAYLRYKDLTQEKIHSWNRYVGEGWTSANWIEKLKALEKPKTPLTENQYSKYD